MNQLIKQNSQGPDIDFVVMRHISNHLRCHILIRTQEGLSLLERVGSIVLDASAEIADLELTIFRNQQVLWLEISVHEAVFVQEIYTRTTLYKVVKGMPLIEPFRITNLLEKIVVLSILHHQVYIVVILQAVIHSHDILVLDLFVNSYLALQILVQAMVMEVFARNSLHSYLSSCLDVDSRNHLAMRTFT
jgi:hypothetical protein